MNIDISVVVPVTERPASLVDLYHEYAAPIRNSEKSYEFVFALEPWFEELAHDVEALALEGEPIKVLRVSQTAGESSLLRLAVANTRGRVIVTLPAYFRVEASTLTRLISCVENGTDIAVARRWPRRDSWINRLQNRTFHAALARVGRTKLRDVACGVRALRRDVFDRVPLYGDFFRFWPLLALAEGYDVAEIDARQHELDRRSRVYSPGVYLRRAIDILGIFFLLRFTRKPLRFFGLLGSASALLGSAILALLAVQRIGGTGIANRPILLLGVLLVVLGVQAIALGLVGEIIVHLHISKTGTYRVRSSQDSG